MNAWKIFLAMCLMLVAVPAGADDERAAEIWSAENRVSVGAGYTLYEREETSARFLVEYRFTAYRRGGAARGLAAPEQNEAFAKLQVSYR